MHEHRFKRPDDSPNHSDEVETEPADTNPWRHRRKVYSIKDINAVETYCRGLALGQEGSFYEFTKGGGEPYFIHRFSENLELWVGPITALDSSLYAVMTLERQFGYATRGTLGEEFPLTDSTVVQEFQTDGLVGLSKDRVVAILHTFTSEGYVPLAGVQAYWGSQEQTLQDFFAAGSVPEAEKQSSLGSFAATAIRLDSPELANFLAACGQLIEKNVAVMTGLFSQEKEVLRNYEIEHLDVAWLMMAALAEGIHRHNQLQRSSLEEAQIVLYDALIHIHKKLVTYFNMGIIATPEYVAASKGILQTIHKYHYGKEFGGLEGEIMVGYNNLPEYLEKARAFLLEKGVVLPPYQKSNV